MAYIGEDRIAMTAGPDRCEDYLDDLRGCDLSDDSWALMNPAAQPPTRARHDTA